MVTWWEKKISFYELFCVGNIILCQRDKISDSLFTTPSTVKERGRRVGNVNVARPPFELEGVMYFLGRFGFLETAFLYD